ncbi:MAG TPA: hypothetical protein VK154_05175 [Chitinophagales bacterium]|nr:hypothetical protein [Chitinophagales bacterium]
MITKHLLIPLLVVCFLLEDCNKLSKCKRFVGNYQHHGQMLSVSYDGVNFTLTEAGNVMPCTCTNQGNLTIKGAAPATILLSDSGGIKRFCFEQDSLKRDCAYAIRK